MVDPLASPYCFSDDAALTSEQLVRLYDSVGWTAYTDHPGLLQRAVNASLRVVTAWDGEELIGLARIVGDGLTMVYLQDILIDPAYQSRGLGCEWFQRVFAPFEQVRQKFLVTDGTEQQRGFYTAMGFTPLSELPTPVVAYGRLA
ncbi:MAG: GNAT family N-acetyltransferase [Galactobacter sp.]